MLIHNSSVTISTFGPQIFEALGLVGDLWIVAYVLSNLFFVIGYSWRCICRKLGETPA